MGISKGNFEDFGKLHSKVAQEVTSRFHRNLSNLSKKKQHGGKVGSLKSCGGYPWNGMNPETGETQYFKSTSWFRIADTLPK